MDLPTRPLCPGGRVRRPLAVTVLGLGGAGIGGVYGEVTDRDATATVQAALEQGVSLIDTSPLYGESQRRIGAALSPAERERVVLSTKVGTHPSAEIRGYTADRARRSLEDSFRQLRTDHVELCLIHDPSPADLAVALGPGGALAYLTRAKEQRVIEAIGLGVRDHRLLREAMATGQVDVVLTYRDYTLAERSAAQGVFPSAQRRGVGVMLGSPLAAGLLAGPEPRVWGARRREEERHVRRAQEVWTWARARGLDMLPLALQFCARHPAVATVLLGAARPEEIRRDAHALREPVAEGVWAELEALQGAWIDAPG